MLLIESKGFTSCWHQWEGKGVTVELEKIPFGHRNPMTRPSNKNKDRALRREIEKANNKDDCIINVGNGYYRPVPGDAVDEKELNEYFAVEASRARSIDEKCSIMKRTFERRREDGVFADNSWETG